MAIHPLFESLQTVERIGRVYQVDGLKIASYGPPNTFIGELCIVYNLEKQAIMHAEVIGFHKDTVYLMPFSAALIGIYFAIHATGQLFTIQAHQGLLGQVLNAFALPFTSKVQHFAALSQRVTHHEPINPLMRKPITKHIKTGIVAIDSLLPMGRGQRMGIFAGSGVGKSSLLGMIAQHSDHDVNIIALIGERGREVNDFIALYLTQETRQKSILVVACSDEPALVRRQAAYTATALAEFFSQQGKHVMLFLDSITRFAMAQRDISLSLGELPTARGYTPSVFSLLPGLVERAGCFAHQGSISAFYTVLVEGDELDEPLSDHMRSLLDGHIVLSRTLAERHHYPAIAILSSISRLSQQLLSYEHQIIVDRVIFYLSMYQQHQDLLELGAYKSGSNLDFDKAIAIMPALNAFLTSTTYDSFSDVMHRLQEIVQ